MNASAIPPAASPIRLLLVEDVATDAELEVRELRRAGMRVDPRVVSTEPGFIDAIRTFLPQVIISDFSMPHFDGMAALDLARRLVPDVPFLFVSGTIGEEYAIRALKNGAIDYVLKTNLVRLPAAVERALRDAAERSARLEAETMFRDVLEHAPDPMIVVNAAGTIVLANGQSERSFGYPRAELVGRAVERLAPQGLQGAHVTHSEGHSVPVEISVAPLGSRQELLTIAVIRDQTERRAQEMRIARLSRIRNMLGATNAAIMRIRERGALFSELCRIAVAEGGFEIARVTVKDADGKVGIGATSEPGIAFYENLIDAINRDPDHPSLLGTALRTGRAMVSNDLSSDSGVAEGALDEPGGSLSLALLPIEVEGRVAGVFGLRARDAGAFDPEELRLIEEMIGNIAFALELMDKQGRLDYLAYYDALTGLPNRTLFQDRLAQAVEAARRDRGQLGLAIFNLERFRAINDALGEHAGDEAIRTIAGRLLEASGDATRVARLIGDSFAVMFPDVEDPADVARTIGDAGNRMFGTALTLAGKEMRVSAKAGIAVFPADGIDAETLMRNAEAALAAAGETGERYRFYAPQINARVAEQVELEQRLRSAVDNGELSLHYQPKVDLQSREIVGVEALMRWNGPDGKPVSPARFVPLLEETGLIFEAGRQAIAGAARAHAAWREAGLAAPRVAVNVSALQLRDPDFIEVLKASLRDASQAGVDLEVTESLMMEDVESSIAKLRVARDLGVNISLDDFGTGYSSLAYLSRLPIDTLKIDRAFIKDITENTNDVSLVTTMISLAQSLRLKVVAEGVETEEQARLLRLLRCDQMQGFLFSPAVPADRIAALLRDRAGAP